MEVALRQYHLHPTAPRVVVGIGTSLVVFHSAQLIFKVIGSLTKSASPILFGYRFKRIGAGAALLLAHGIISERGCVPIEVTEESIKNQSSALLSRLAFQLEKKIKQGYPDPKIVVKFYEIREGMRHKGAAADAGGPSREYLYQLCSQVRKILAPADQTGLYIPAGAECKAERARLHRNWGFLLMYCYHSQPYNVLPFFDSSCSTGIHMDPSAIQSAFSLSAEEVDGDLDKLDIVSRAKLYQAIIRTLVPEAISACKTLERVIEGEEQAKQHLERLMEDPIEGISAREQLLGYVTQQLEDKKLKERLVEVQQLARGMKRWCDANSTQSERSWDAVRHLTPVVFSEKAQGLMDRQAIAERIRPSLLTQEMDKPVVNRLIEWLQAWIQDPDTPSEKVLQFVQQITGTNGLKESQHIVIAGKLGDERKLAEISDPEVLRQMRTEPALSTCELKLYLPLDHLAGLSREEFIGNYLQNRILGARGFTEI